MKVLRSVTSSGANVSAEISKARGARLSTMSRPDSVRSMKAPPAIFRMGPGFHKAANHQAVDHALDGGTIHDGVAAEQVLRQRSSLSELRQGRPLGRRDVAIGPRS